MVKGWCSKTEVLDGLSSHRTRGDFAFHLTRESSLSAGPRVSGIRTPPTPGSKGKNGNEKRFSTNHFQVANSVILGSKNDPVNHRLENFSPFPNLVS